MQLLIKQRVFSLVATYDIYDESEQPRYYVKSKAFSIGHQIHVFNKQTGEEVGAIKQKLLTLMPKFEIIIGGHVVGTISREFSFLRPKYHVDFQNWEVDGDFMGWNYVALRDGCEVLRVEKDIVAWSDTYAIHYTNHADEVPGLLLVLAIDAVNHDRDSIKTSLDI